jgi:hypothetical protein
VYAVLLSAIEAAETISELFNDGVIEPVDSEVPDVVTAPFSTSNGEATEPANASTNMQA